MPAPMLYLEDFAVGMVVEMQGPTLDEADMIDFSRKYDPQPFHIDPVAAQGTIYGGLIASGWQTVGLCMRMIVDGYLGRAASLGSPGVQDIRWLKPVRAGDTLRLRMTVKENRRSQSKPDRGVVLHYWETFNQLDELVMTMQGFGMFKVRGAV